MELYVNMVHFFNLLQVVLKDVPLERWIQFVIGGFKTVNLAWANKVVMIGYTWLFVYESLRMYEGRMIAATSQLLFADITALVIESTEQFLCLVIEFRRM